MTDARPLNPPGTPPRFETGNRQLASGSERLRHLLVEFGATIAPHLRQQEAELRAHPVDWEPQLARTLSIWRVHLITLRHKVATLEDADPAANQAVLEWITASATGLEYLVKSVTGDRPKAAVERARSAKEQFAKAWSAVHAAQRELKEMT